MGIQLSIQLVFNWYSTGRGVFSWAKCRRGDRAATLASTAAHRRGGGRAAAGRGEAEQAPSNQIASGPSGGESNAHFRVRPNDFRGGHTWVELRPSGTALLRRAELV